MQSLITRPLSREQKDDTRFFPLRRADPEGNRASWKRVGVCFGRLALTGGSDILSCSVIETEAAQRFPRFFFFVFFFRERK